MRLTTNTTTIPNSLIENLPLFEPREIVILLVLFYHSPAKFTDIISETGLSEAEVKKYTVSLMKYAAVNQNTNGDYYLGVDVDINGLKSRAAPKAKQSKTDFTEVTDTDGIKIEVTKWEDFMPSAKMADVQRKMIYLFFKAVGFDVNFPYPYIQDLNDWRQAAFKLYQAVGNDVWLINEAAKKLKEGKMTVAHPRALMKTIHSLRVSGAGSVNEVKDNKKEETITDLW